MGLTADEKSLVKTFWSKVEGKADDIGAQAVGRMLVISPTTKTYFAHLPDFSPDSDSVKKHGKTIMGAVADAVVKIDDIMGGLSALSDLHGTKLRVEPTNFEAFTFSLIMTFAVNFSSDFTPDVHEAMERFLEAVSAALADKYQKDVID